MKTTISTLFLGILFGFTIGALIGMSNAPVVGAFIAAAFPIVPGLALLLQPTSRKGSILAIAKSFLKTQIYIGVSGFLLFLLVGLGSGVFVKKSNWLFGSHYKIEINDLEEAGFSKTDALAILKSRLVKNTTVPKKPTIHFSKAQKNSVFCQQRPSKISNDYTDLLPLFIKQGGLPEIAIKSLESFVQNTAESLSPVKGAPKEIVSFLYLDTVWAISCQTVEGRS